MTGSKRKLYLICLFILAVSGCFMLFIPMGINRELANGLLTGTTDWFYKSFSFFSVTVIVTELLRRKRLYRITWADIMVIILLIMLLATYDWELDPNRERLHFSVELCLFWFVLRYVLTYYHTLSNLFIVVILLTGFTQAVLGISQLYGYAYSNHSLFSITGSFYNPGPFSGFIAVILPVAAGMILQTGQPPKEWLSVKTFTYYYSWVCLLVILMILPAGMSRSSWIGAIISCGWLCVMYRFDREKRRSLWQKYRSWITGGMVVGIVLIGFALAGIYHMKKDSADGRLLMWKISCHAIAAHPLKGTGIAGFPAAFAESQAIYFAEGKGTHQEQMVAGCPEYAFNEYLHFGVEQGLTGLAAFVGWLAFSIYMGIRNKRYPATAGILSLAIFAFSSYPLQLPCFWVLLIYLCAIAISGPSSFHFKKPAFLNKTYPLIGFFTALASLYQFHMQRNAPDHYKEWTRAKAMYSNKSWERAIPRYDTLYPYLNNKPEFLFEYGQCLGNNGRYEQAIEVLERATRLSGDPMIHYMVAKNKQKTGAFDEAEQRLQHAIHILPERIYPYYLLTQLYADSLNYQPEKLKWAADSVLFKTPKVESTAIREMRQEVKKLLERIE